MDFFYIYVIPEVFNWESIAKYRSPITDFGDDDVIFIKKYSPGDSNEF